MLRLDPRAARNLFPLTEHCIFMNHAGVSPLSARVVAAVEGVLTKLSQHPYPDDYAQVEAAALRGRLPSPTR